MKIGFIGLGNMGLPMALNLMNAGHEVTGFDAMSPARDAAAEQGLAIGQSASETAREKDAVILMLPNGSIVLSVLNEIISDLSADTLVIDCSTIDVASSRTFHEQCSDAGALSLDAPVSGGVGGASAGTLTFMVGGSDASFSKGETFFDIMGQKAVHCGDGGAGQSAKICNNMLLGISMIGAGEAFALAEKLGLDQSRLFDVVSTSSGFCWSVNKYCPVKGVGPDSPADNDFKPGFATALMLKDLLLSQQAASEASASTPMGAAATKHYQTLADAGLGDMDFSGVIQHLDKLS